MPTPPGVIRSKAQLEALGLQQTRMCKFFRKARGCSTGVGCPFAHADDELKTPPDLYKTFLCRVWNRKGTCKAGDKCTFAHGRKELRSNPVAAAAAAQGSGGVAGGGFPQAYLSQDRFALGPWFPSSMAAEAVTVEPPPGLAAPPPLGCFTSAAASSGYEEVAFGRSSYPPPGLYPMAEAPGALLDAEAVGGSWADGSVPSPGWDGNRHNIEVFAPYRPDFFSYNVQGNIDRQATTAWFQESRQSSEYRRPQKVLDVEEQLAAEEEALAGEVLRSGISAVQSAPAKTGTSFCSSTTASDDEEIPDASCLPITRLAAGRAGGKEQTSGLSSTFS